MDPHRGSAPDQNNNNNIPSRSPLEGSPTGRFGGAADTVATVTAAVTPMTHHHSRPSSGGGGSPTSAQSEAPLVVSPTPHKKTSTGASAAAAAAATTTTTATNTTPSTQSPPPRPESRKHEELWKLHIRSVSPTSQPDLIVPVDPLQDTLEHLYQKIASQTGQPEPGRLIYRGRLLSTPTLRIQDIPGLSDGQCLHLIPKPASSNNSNRTTEDPNNTSSNSSRSNSPNLLRTILGLEAGGSNNTSGDNNNNNAASNSANATTQVGGHNNRRRRPFSTSTRRHRPYRLTAEDLEPTDPGSLEPVRQALMTLHTLLPSATEAASTSNPLANHRQWYRGQWVDCRDTVNQWLEATIVDIRSPEEILPHPTRPDGEEEDALQATATTQPLPVVSTVPVTDPPVHADDWQGRTRLLLEPCPAGCPEQDEGGEWSGFRRRASNANAVLLLIHYNGWPHRWDEWIRSDSERLRPFRVRTRHPTNNRQASPIVQAPFSDQPSTAILRPGATDVEDRQHVLPELLRVMQQVQGLLEQSTTPTTTLTTTLEGGSETNGVTAASSIDLPWNTNDTNTGALSTAADDEESTVDGSVDATSSTDGVLPNVVVEQPSTPSQHHQTSSSSSRRQQREQQRTLRALAPLLDRLGRAMVDVAPHVASLAATMETAEDPPEPQLDTIEEHPGSLGGLLSLLSRDRRRNSMASSQAVASLSTADQTATVDQATVVTANSEVSTSIDPDYTDFATGAVNTVRGEVRTGPRARGAFGSSGTGGGSSPSEDLSSLLGAYIAAASLTSEGNGTGRGEDSNLQMLGRLLRDRDSGGAGGGIDIHIHAVVTAPGMMTDGPTTGTVLGETTTGTTAGGGGLGGFLASLGVTDTSTTNDTTNNDAASRAATLAADLESFLPVAQRVTTPAEAITEDDMGIFSELYSENPTPTAGSSPESTHVPLVSPPSSPSRLRHGVTTSGRSRGTTTTGTASPPAGSRSRSSPSRTNNNGSTPPAGGGSNNSTRRQGFLGRFLRRNQGTE